MTMWTTQLTKTTDKPATLQYIYKYEPTIFPLLKTALQYRPLTHVAFPVHSELSHKASKCLKYIVFSLKSEEMIKYWYKTLLSQ